MALLANDVLLDISPQATRNSSPESSSPSLSPKIPTLQTSTPKFTAPSPVPVSLLLEVDLEVEVPTMDPLCCKSDLMVEVLELAWFEVMEVPRGSRRRLCRG